ncbi:MAG: 8-oxo-dGTP diphosphatase MutT [Limisphaerales bacterium]
MANQPPGDGPAGLGRQHDPDPEYASGDGSLRWVEVAAGLVFRNRRLLITRRSVGTHLAGLWEFPGGKREAGETWEACLARELREELDVEVVVGGLFEEVRHEYPGKAVHLRFFRCRIAHGEPRPVGCAELAWVTRERLRDYAFPEADATLLDRLETLEAAWDDGPDLTGTVGS